MILNRMLAQVGKAHRSCETRVLPEAQGFQWLAPEKPKVTATPSPPPHLELTPLGLVLHLAP